MPDAPPGSRAPRNSVTARPAAAAARQLPSGQAAAPALATGRARPAGRPGAGHARQASGAAGCGRRPAAARCARWWARRRRRAPRPRPAAARSRTAARAAPGPGSSPSGGGAQQPAHLVLAQGPAPLILSPLVLGELGAVVLGALLGVAGADLTVGRQGGRHRRDRSVQGEQQHASQAYRSTSSRLSTLPDGPSGIASTNSTLRGYLYLASRSFDQVMIAAPSSSSLPSASGERTTTAQTSSPSCGSGTAITATCATASWRSSTSSTSRG